MTSQPKATRPVVGADGRLDRDGLAAYLDDVLQASQGHDYCPNGLQVEGRPTIGRIVTAVSACQELFERAAESKADAVLVHHGLLWHGQPLPLTGIQYRRVAALIRSEISLLAYHLPLDRDARFGNNAVAVRELGLSDLTPFGEHKGLPLGFSGRYAEPIGATELVERCRSLFGQEPLTFPYGPEQISSVGMISGAAQSEVHRAISQGLDAFITGEATEWVMNIAKEAGIHYLACGHYATERLGVRALGEHLAQRFEVDVEFVDIPNPV